MRRPLERRSRTNSLGPHSFFAAWKDRALDLEIVGAEGPIGPGLQTRGEGPMLLSAKDAAEWLGVSRSVVYDLVRVGELEHVRLGKRVLISRVALNALIEANSKVGYYG